MTLVRMAHVRFNFALVRPSRMERPRPFTSQPRTNASSASRVPSTRARIFANARSREVDRSSAKGEKPQSSVVPNWADGIYSAASRTRSLTSSVDSTQGSITPNKDAVTGLDERPDALQGPARFFFGGHRDMKIAYVYLEQGREQVQVVDVRTVGGVPVASRAGVNPKPGTFVVRKRFKAGIQQRHKTPEEFAGGIQFYSETPFREVDLYLVRARVQAPAHFADVFTNEVRQESFTRIMLDTVRRVDQAEERRRNNRLFDSSPGQFQSSFEVPIGTFSIAKGTLRQSRQLPGMSIGKPDFHAVRSKVFGSVQAIEGETAVFALLAVADDGRTRLLESVYGICGRPIRDSMKLLLADPAFAERFFGADQFLRAWNGTDGLGGYGYVGHSVSPD